MPSSVEHLVAGLLHDLGARIVVLVDAVAEAHQAEAVVLVLGALDEFRDAVDRADLAQHLERRLVGAAMRRAPQAGDAGGDAGERIGAGRAGEPHRRGRGVLLVVGVQDEDAVHRARQHRVGLVLLATAPRSTCAGSSRRSRDRSSDRRTAGRSNICRPSPRSSASSRSCGSRRSCAGADRRCRWSRDRRPTARRPSRTSPPSDARRGGSPGRSGSSARAPSCGG